VFLTGLNLHDLTMLRGPGERVPLTEKSNYDLGLKLIEKGRFESFDSFSEPSGPLDLKMHWQNDEAETSQTTKEKSQTQVSVRVLEVNDEGHLQFFCEQCSRQKKDLGICAHTWASYVLFWRALVAEKGQLVNPELYRLSDEIKQRIGSENDQKAEPEKTIYDHVKLESISLFLDENSLLKGPSIFQLFDAEFSKYKKHEVTKDEEVLAPGLWNLPEVFRKKLSAFSESYFNEVNKQNRLAEVLCYNFSNGIQLSAKEILRHPFYKKVPGDLLPQGKTGATVFDRWPFLQTSENAYVSPQLAELEDVMQTLISKVVAQHRRGKLDLFIQSKSSANGALKMSEIEFELSQELDWRVEFKEGKALTSEFQLVSFRKQALKFYESFAVDQENKVIYVHPWYRELTLLQKKLSEISQSFVLAEQKMPGFELENETQAKTILKHLRSRTIPVKIKGDTQHLAANQSVTEIRLDDKGCFYIQHDGKRPGLRNITRRGWSTKSVVYFQALSQGIGFLLKSQAKDVAARSLAKREWDLKLLKHLGILQYLFMETLSVHFEGTLSSGEKIETKDIFKTLEPRIHALLTSGQTGSFVREKSLAELCSKSVLSCLEDFTQMILKTVQESEAFYSEDGEVILQGVIEREFRLIFELIRKMAQVSHGEAFKRTRTTFLSKVYTGDFEKDVHLNEGLFYFSESDKKLTHIRSAIESLQPLIIQSFKIYYQDELLQELEDNEFRVDFILQSDTQDKNYNWFELNPKFFLRGEEVDPEHFLSLGAGGVIEYKGKLYLVPQKQLPSLRRLENFWHKLQKGKAETSQFKGAEKVYQLPKHQTLELLALRASGIAIRGDHEWNKLCQFYDQLGKEEKAFVPPKSTTAVLKAYQLTGVKWLQDLFQLRLGALLADDMGLGKTLQTLAFLDDLREKGSLGQTLIIVPSSLIFNWLQESEKFTPLLPMQVFTNKDRDRISKGLEAKQDVVLIATYGLLMEHEDFLNQYKWRVLIFDEAQNIKNLSAKRTSAARSLTAQFKICLTGTPMENHYGEFYSLVDLLVPGSLGRIDEFRREFVNTEVITKEQMDDLKLKIKPLLMRRTKKEILDQLPDKQETKVSIAFEERQKEIYRDIALSYNQRVKEAMVTQGPASVQLQMLTALLRLRQACSDPAALPNVRYDKVPPKLETLLESLQEIVESGESALVFTQFLQTLEHTAEILKKAGIPVFVLHGGVPTKQRQHLLADFNNTKGGAVLVMTLKTGGVGLNLTKASYVFHLEPWWNPSVENQATDRAHRLGQNKAVQVFRYIMHESLEEKIELLKVRKDVKFQSLFTQTEKDVEVGVAGAALSKADFDLLLGLK
jgi:SNF2 family DNA or RNA helicase